MRRVLALLTCLAALAAPSVASAHPLGNFTINRHATVELSGDRIYVHYALDLAEIPAFQLGERVRAAGFAGEAGRGLELRLDGRRAPLRVLERRVQKRPGAGGLETLRFDAVYVADGSGTRLSFRDRNFDSRIGWREIIVRARDGAALHAASVPVQSASDELRAYPNDLLRSPLDVSAATARFSLGDKAGTPPSLSGSAAAERRGGGFEALISRGDLSFGVIVLSLAIAAFWGAAHALTPGHGKAIVAGYLVGTKGRPLDAVLLGGIVTLTHTVGVFALGFVTLLLSQFIVPDQLYPWLTLVSGLLVVAVGLGVLRSRLRTGGWADHDHGDGTYDHGSHGYADHHHGHDHDHHHHLDDHAHGHSHASETHTQPAHAHAASSDDSFTSRGILGVGIAAGLLPCPSALVVLLSAIAVHRVGFGFALIAAFSLGLAATITCIGLIAVLARRAFSRVSFEGRFVRALPALSALVILGVGVALTIKALPGVI